MKLTLKLTFLSLAILTGACATPGPRSHVPGDHYVLYMVWRPTFCAQAENAGLKECQPGATATNLTLDGLSPFWDINSDNRRDDNDRYCTAAGEPRAKLIEMDKAAGNEWSSLPPAPISAATRNALLPVMPRVLSSIDRHEWLKHGNCSELAADDYFALSIKMAKDVQGSAFGRAIVENAGKSVETSVLIQAFTRAFGDDKRTALTLKCEKGPDGKRSLSEARIRILRDVADQGVTGASLDAPAVGKDSDCGKNFTIPAP